MVCATDPLKSTVLSPVAASKIPDVESERDPLIDVIVLLGKVSFAPSATVKLKN